MCVGVGVLPLLLLQTHTQCVWVYYHYYYYKHTRTHTHTHAAAASVSIAHTRPPICYSILLLRVCSSSSRTRTSSHTSSILLLDGRLEVWRWQRELQRSCNGAATVLQQSCKSSSSSSSSSSSAHTHAHVLHFTTRQASQVWKWQRELQQSCNRAATELQQHT